MAASTPSSDGRPGRKSPASKEQMDARRQLAEGRRKELVRKKRTRELIQMGGVCAAHGFTSPGQVDELLKALATREAWVEWLGKRSVDLPREHDR